MAHVRKTLQSRQETHLERVGSFPKGEVVEVAEKFVGERISRSR